MIAFQIPQYIELLLKVPFELVDVGDDILNKTLEMLPNSTILHTYFKLSLQFQSNNITIIS